MIDFFTSIIDLMFDLFEIGIELFTKTLDMSMELMGVLFSRMWDPRMIALFVIGNLVYDKIRRIRKKKRKLLKQNQSLKIENRFDTITSDIKETFAKNKDSNIPETHFSKLIYEVNLEKLPFQEKVEEIAKLLDSVLPILQKKYPDKEITWQTEKIAKTFFPELIHSYIQLNNDTKARKKDAFSASLSSLENELKKVVHLLDALNEKEFDIKAKEISIRFSTLFGD